MPLYAVLADSDQQDLNQRISAQFPENYIKLAAGQWLVSADVIPQQLGDLLNVRTGALGRVIVLELTGAASGWHNKNIWDWLQLKKVTAA